MKTVKIYGPGCKRCEATEALVRETAADAGIDIDVEKISDPRSIAMAGVMSTPGLSVDGTLVHAGGLPKPERLREWLMA